MIRCLVIAGQGRTDGRKVKSDAKRRGMGSPPKKNNKNRKNYVSYPSFFEET